MPHSFPTFKIFIVDAKSRKNEVHQEQVQAQFAKASNFYEYLIAKSHLENKGIVKIFIIRDTLRTTGPFTLISGYSEELASPLSNTKIGQVKDRHLHIFQIKSFCKDCPLIIRAVISMHLIEGNYLEIHLHSQSPSWKFNLSLVSKNNKKIQRAEV